MTMRKISESYIQFEENPSRFLFELGKVVKLKQEHARSEMPQNTLGYKSVVVLKVQPIDKNHPTQ